MPTFTFAMLRKGMPRPKGTAKQRRRTWQRRIRQVEKAWATKNEFSDILRTTPQNFVLARGIHVRSRWPRTRAAKLRAATEVLRYVATI